MSPNTTWVTQQARSLLWDLEADHQHKAYLIRDNDKKFPAAFDTVFTSQGTEIVTTPYRAPRANGFIERFHQDYDNHVWEDTYLNNLAEVQAQGQYFFHAVSQKTPCPS